MIGSITVGDGVVRVVHPGAQVPRRGLVAGLRPRCTALVEDVETVMHADLVDDALRTLRHAPRGHLSRVSEAAVIAAHGDHLVLQMVRAARRAGSSWADIAGALHTPAAGARARPATARPGAARDKDLDLDLELSGITGEHDPRAPRPALPRRRADAVTAP